MEARKNCMVKVDVCSLDNALDTSYVSHLLGGKTINIVYNTLISSLQTIVSADTQINVSRSLSKMKSIFYLSIKILLMVPRERLFTTSGLITFGLLSWVMV